MRPIPIKMREKLASDPRMKRCVLLGNILFGSCEGRIEWEHVWIVAGRQVNEIWAIIGACSKHHSMKDGTPAIKREFQRVSLSLADEEDLAKYPRTNWLQIKKYLSTTL